MTDHAMRQRLAEAMGWTDVRTQPKSGQMWGIDPRGDAGTVPNPLESDRDAALLRAWCVGRGLSLQIIITTDLGPDSAGVRVRAYKPDMEEFRDYSVAESWVWQDDESDPCRRERLALCRAVLQAIEAEGVA